MKKLLGLCLLGALAFTGCDDDPTPAAEAKVELKAHSSSPNFLALTAEFSDVEIFPILTSEDRLEQSPDFIYGSMADGCGLLKNDDNTYTLINNIEADYSIARITLDQTFKPVKGEYILNAEATANTAQCSGTLITPEEHGFGPLYLSGGEWGGSSKGVFATDPFKDITNASTPQLLTALGQWSTENAVPLAHAAYPNQTVVMIGDDQSDNETPSGQLAMYVGDKGDLNRGDLFALKVTDAAITYEMDMEEGQTYPMEFVQLEETDLDLLEEECRAKGVMGFSRTEDIDYRRGSAANNREIYFCVTGRKKDGLIGKGTVYGRIYKVVLNENDPTAAGTITCVLDGDLENGIAKAFHSPDNIVVTRDYAYIQEDPNGYADNADKTHFARLYQYNLNNGELKTVLECDQTAALAQGYANAEKTWELTGMIDISDIINVDNTFLLMTQNHGWDNGFTDPTANPDTDNAREEGSMLFVVKGLER